jgi:hypothetical protein
MTTSVGSSDKTRRGGLASRSSLLSESAGQSPPLVT